MEDNERKFKDEQQRLGNEIFWASFQTIFVFAVPAVAAALLGVWLDGIYQSGKKITIALLIASFVLSWAIIALQYRRLTKKIEALKRSKSNKNI